MSILGALSLFLAVLAFTLFLVIFICTNTNMNTQATEVSLKDSSSNSEQVLKQSTALFSSFLSADIAKALADRGFKECSTSVQNQVTGLRSYDDRVFSITEAQEFTHGLLCCLHSEHIEINGKGHTIVLSSADKIEVLSKTLGKATLDVLDLGGKDITISNPNQVILGSTDQITDFFKSDIGRATRVGRLVVQDVENLEIDSLKTCLAEACKRGQRPQLVLVSSENNSIIQELTRSFLRSTAHVETHYFVQLQADGKSRVDSLVESLESEGLYPAVVFCKHAAEVGAVEGALLNRGLTARKLTGRVAPHHIREILSDLRSGEARVLLCTDSASEQIELDYFRFIVNLSIPSEPEIYIHRTESPLGVLGDRKVLNIITSLDRANFDYIKRIVAAQFEETKGPDSETLLLRQLERIESDAAEKFTRCDDRLKDMASRLAQGTQVKELIGLLLLHLESKASGTQKSPVRQSERAVRPDYFDDDNDVQPQSNAGSQSYLKRERGNFRIGGPRLHKDGSRDERPERRSSSDRERSNDRDNRDRDNDRGNSRGNDRVSRASDRGGNRGNDREVAGGRGGDRNAERGNQRNNDRNNDRNNERSSDRGNDRKNDYNGERSNVERGNGRNNDSRNTNDANRRSETPFRTRSGGMQNTKRNREDNVHPSEDVSTDYNARNMRARPSRPARESRNPRDTQDRDRDSQDRNSQNRDAHESEARTHVRTPRTTEQNSDTDSENRFSVKKLSRIYFGKGSKDGLSVESLKSLRVTDTEGNQVEIANCSVRPNYAFVDISEHLASNLIDVCKNNPPAGVKDLTVTKAISITSKERIEPSAQPTE
jgi:superfamily II DNA/RNA helicase